MKLEVVMGEKNKMDIEYDDEARDILIKSAIYAALYSAIDNEKIATLEETIREQQETISSLQESLAAALVS